MPDKESTPAETKSEQPAAPAVPTPASDPGVTAGATKDVKASSLVADDHDKFPPSRDDDDGSDPADDFEEGDNPDPDQPRRNLGGRPKGKKDSYPRGRPQRKDWANEPMRRKSKGGYVPVGDDLPDPNKEERRESETSKPQQSAAQPVDYKALASFAVDMTTGALAGFLGAHWKPMPAPGAGLPDEREMLIGNLARYLEENQIKDIPPGMMLAISLAGYAIPRVIITLKMRSDKKSQTEQPRRVNPHPAAEPPPPPPPASTSRTAPEPAASAPMPGRPGDARPSADFGPIAEDEA